MLGSEHFSIFWMRLHKIGVNDLNIRQYSLVKSSGPGYFFRAFKLNFNFFNSYITSPWLNFSSLGFSKIWSISFKSNSMKLFVVFPYYAFNSCMIYCDIHHFILILMISLFVGLAKHFANLLIFFQRNSCFINFLHCFSVFNLTYLCYSPHYFFYSVYFGFTFLVSWGGNLGLNLISSQFLM